MVAKLEGIKGTPGYRELSVSTCDPSSGRITGNLENDNVEGQLAGENELHFPGGRRTRSYYSMVLRTRAMPTGFCCSGKRIFLSLQTDAGWIL
jgi:hypothetical protein